ncbi:MAG: HEAT repeat domain-containing protein [Phycisphaerae bacterium]
MLLALMAAMLGGTAGCGDQEREIEFGWLTNLFRSKKDRLHEKALDKRNPQNRIEAIYEMSEESWGRQEPYLEAYAGFAKEDLYPSVRAAGVTALARSNAREYMPVIIESLNDRSELVRTAGAAALVEMPDPNAITPLTQAAMDDESADVRSTAAEALRHYRDPDAVATLVKCLADPEFAVRYQAHESLVYITGVDRGYETWDWPAESQGHLPKVAPRSERAWWDPWDWWGTKEESPAPATQPANP